MGKRIHKVLRGVAITGATVGGTSVLGDATLAFAHEADESILAASGEYTLEIATEEVQEARQEEAVVEKEKAEAEEERTLLVQDKEAAQHSLIEEEEKMTQAVAEEAEAQENRSQAVEAKAAAEQEKQQVENEMAEKQAAYEQAGYANAGLDEQEEEIAKKAIAEAAARNAVVNDEKRIYLETGSYYKVAARPLAKEMIKYSLLLSGQVKAEELDQVAIGEWFDSNTYENKHFCVRYVDADGQLHEKYFDYVTCDENGTSMIKNSSSDRHDDIAENVIGINLLEKTPTYNYYEGDNESDFKAYEATKENRQKYATELKNKKMKLVTVSGKEFIIPQRGGWVAANGTFKGEDYYTMDDYQEDIKTRQEWPGVLQAFAERISSIDATIEALEQTIAAADENISMLQDTIEEINANIATLTETINTIDEKIGVLDEKIEGYEKDIENLKAEITRLEDTVSTLENKVETVESSNSGDSTISSANVNLTVENVVTSASANVTSEEIIEEETPVRAVASSRTAVVQELHEVEAPLAVGNLEEPEDVEIQQLTISDQEVARRSDEYKPTTKWMGTTLPVLGALAGIFGIGKLNRDSKDKDE